MVGIKEVSNYFQDYASKLPPYKGSRGSIVRLRIHNLMTYEDVEMKAGPNINLVMGPNGVGKSTISCAICLVLNGKTGFLGRAKNLKDFIRHSCTEAYVEIELFNPEPNKTNWIIRRDIKETPTGTSTTWSLNGQPQREQQIEEFTKSLNIQVDNLCQFLPQDRVQDFARQDSVQLLKSTEKAVNLFEGVNLIQLHDNLVAKQKTIAVTSATIANKEKELTAEAGLNRRLEVEVQQFEEREKLKKQIHTLNSKKLWLVYLQSLNKFNKLKEESEEAKHEEEIEKKRIAPLKKAVDTLTGKHLIKQSHRNKVRSSLTGTLLEEQRKYRDNVDQADQDIAELQAQLTASEEEEQNRIKKYQDNRQKLHSLEAEYHKIMAEETRSESLIRQEMSEWEDRSKKVEQECLDILNDITSLEAEVQSCRTKRELIHKKLKEFDDVRKNREIHLRNKHPELMDAVEYFRRPGTRDRFKGEIHEPMLLTLKIRDEQKDGNIIEKFMAYDDLISFFFEDKDDLKTMIQITKENKLRASCVHHQMDSNWRRPPSADLSTLRKFDFQRCCIDLIEIDDYFLSYLCQKKHIHTVVIGTDRTDGMVQQIMEETPLRQFFTASSSYIIRESLYSCFKNVSRTQMMGATIFTDKLNYDEKDGFLKQAEELTANIDRALARAEEIRPRHDELTSSINQFNQKQYDLRNMLNKKLNYESRIAQTRMIMQQSEHPANHLVTREKVQGLTYVARYKQMNECLKAVNKICNVGKQWAEVLHAKRQTAFLGKFVELKQQQYEEAKQNVTALAEKARNLKIKTEQAAVSAKNHKIDAQKANNGINDPPSELRKQSAEDADGSFINLLDTDIHALQAQLNFLPELDRRTIEEYKARQQVIARLVQEKSQLGVKLENEKNGLEQLKSEWLGPLERLLHLISQNFSGFFASMRCVGEVSLDKGDESKEDFSKYGVKIKVKFRSDEPLDALSGWKQSGGEQAITTALYVLSIQSLTKVPFRVVDEINQGMDAKNETKFFELLCTLAKGSDTPQYFLLTPKMLPPVEYPDNVDFHIIFNGPYVKAGKLPDLSFKRARGRGRRGRRRSDEVQGSDMEIEQ